MDHPLRYAARGVKSCGLGYTSSASHTATKLRGKAPHLGAVGSVTLMRRKAPPVFASSPWLAAVRCSGPRGGSGSRSRGACCGRPTRFLGERRMRGPGASAEETAAGIQHVLV